MCLCIAEGRICHSRAVVDLNNKGFVLHEKLGVWQIVDPPPHANIIPSHVVLATKHGADGGKLKL
jgi:hypothetical protein